MSTIDYRKMDKFIDGVKVQDGKKDDDKAFALGQYWWKKSGPEMAQAIAASLKFMIHHQATRTEQLIASTRLYGANSAFNFIGPALSKSAASSASGGANRVSYNLCSSVVDTMVSKAAKNKVIPTFNTSGGVWGMQKKAEDLSKFVEGWFYEQKVHKKSVEQFRDGGVWGTGIVHVFEEDDQAKVERVFPHELVVDPIEALSGNPRQLHRVKIVDRGILLDLFKDDEKAVEAIKKANPSSYIEVGAEGTAADLLTVTESWHLRSGKDCDDGVHVLCLEDTILTPEDEMKYDNDYFPFVFWHYNKRLMGFWGQGACERLQPLQLEINRLMVLDQKSRWMQSSFKILVENGSKVVAQHLNNEVGTIIYYTGTPPQYILPPAIDPSNETKLDSLIAKGYQQEGVSQLAAASLKPQGVDSGAALRTYDQIADDRLMFLLQELEQAVLEVARQGINVIKDIYKRKGTYKVLFPSTKFLESIDWKDVKLDEDEYVLRAYPTSSLPDDPAGRLQYVQEQMQAGLISPRAGRRLLAQPDIEMSDKLANAAEDLIHKVLEEMLNDGEYRAPEPQYDLAMCKSLYLQYYNYAVLNNCPDDKLSVLRRFGEQVDDLLGINAPQPAQSMAASGVGAIAPPMANPAPAPVSPMLQNTNNAAVQ